MYYFLKYVSPKFTHFNKLFQSEKLNVHFLDRSLTTNYKAFLSCYTSTTYLQSRPINDVDPTFFIAYAAFILHAQATTQIKQHFLIDNPIIKSLGFLNLDTLHSTKVADVLQIASKSPNVESIEDLRNLMMSGINFSSWIDLTF